MVERTGLPGGLGSSFSLWQEAGFSSHAAKSVGVDRDPGYWQSEPGRGGSVLRLLIRTRVLRDCGCLIEGWPFIRAQERGPLRGLFRTVPRPSGAPPCAYPGLLPTFSEWRASSFFHPAAPVPGAMAFPHRPDAPELPDFSMLKRLARDQLIYLLEQVSARHSWGLFCINSLALSGRVVFPWRSPLDLLPGPWSCPWSFCGRSKMKHLGRKTRGQ